MISSRFLQNGTDDHEPIRIGVVGIGSIGKGIVYQSQITPGIRCTAIADIHIERAIECAKLIGRDYRLVTDLDALHAAVERGELALCEDGSLLAQSAMVQVLIDASNAIQGAAQFDVAALEHHKHLVMMNAEADLIFGPHLMGLARENGVVYTSCDGDQPVIIKRLVDEIRFWGFDLVMAGNIKGFLDRYSNPTKIIPEADKRMLDPRMAASYTDGTKINVEMALVANALGLSALVPGMRGPRAAHVRDVLSLFDLPEIWKEKHAIVDYILGAEPKGGVFAIGYTENEYQRSMLEWFPPQMGGGPFYVFYRPYHLGHVEALNSVFAAARLGRALLQPERGFQTNVYAYAKRDLGAGEVLDGIGGYACYGLIENCADAGDGLPICLAGAMRLKRDIARDGKIFWGDVEYDERRPDIQLHARGIDPSRQ